MQIDTGSFPGVQIIKPRRFSDERGYFFESWNERDYEKEGIGPFVQDNISHSKAGVLRGLHYQYPRQQAKLVSVLRGEVYDVIVDIRRNSPTFGAWSGHYLSEKNGAQIYIPEGFAHGFCVTGDEALFHYKCSDFYAPDSEHTIRWDDPTLQIDWPLDAPILSEKDYSAPALQQLPDDALPLHQSA